MRILVTGSRTFTNAKAIENVLSQYAHLKDFTTITVIDGAAKGADNLAHSTAKKLGYCVKRYRADWLTLGIRAGLARNERMLKEGKPHLVLAFWDGTSRGTLDMITRAKKAGVPVETYYF